MGIRDMIRNGLDHYRMSHTDRHLAHQDLHEIDPFIVARINQKINRGRPNGRASYSLDWHAISAHRDDSGGITAYTLDFSMHHDDRNNKKVHGSIAYFVSFRVDKNDEGMFVATEVGGIVGREHMKHGVRAIVPGELVFITKPALETSLAIVRLVLDENGFNPDCSRESRDILRKAMKQFIKGDIALDVDRVRPSVRPLPGPTQSETPLRSLQR